MPDDRMANIPLATVDLKTIDEVLLPFLEAATPEAEDRALESLMQQVEPVMRYIIRKKALLFVNYGSRNTVSREEEQGEDTYCMAALRLLEKLHQLKCGHSLEIAPSDLPTTIGTNAPAIPTTAGDAYTIRSVRGLAETITRNLLHEQLRKKYPRRASLQNQLTYVIQNYRDPKTHKTRFAVWHLERDRLCGFLEWVGRALVLTHKYQKLKDDAPTVGIEVLPHDDTVSVQLHKLLEAVLHWLDTPLDFDDMVSTVAVMRGVVDTQDTSIDTSSNPDDDDAGASHEPPSADLTPEEQIILRNSLQHLWGVIRDLPPQQCASLLLNLKDHRGNGVIDLLPVLGIATLREIAAAMAMPAEKLSQIWRTLPLEDNQIASLLNCETRSIAAWRWRARQKLETAMKSVEFHKGTGSL